MSTSKLPAFESAQNISFFKSLRFKALFLMTFMIAAVTLISAFYFSWQATKLIFDSALERVDTVGKNFAFNAEYGLLIRDREILSQLAKGVILQKSILAAAVMDIKGDTVARESHQLNEEAFKKISDYLPNPGTLEEAVKKNIPGAGEVYILFHPVFTESQKPSEELALFDHDADTVKEIIGHTAVIFSPSVLYEKVKKIRSGILLLLGAFSLAIMIFVFVVTSFFVRQLRRLLEAMQKIGQGDLSARVNIRSQDELGELCLGFNHMSEALQKTTVSRDALAKEIEERKRLEHMMLQAEKMSAIGQLAGGVAHEINNPLGVILGFSQNVVKRLPPGDPFEMPLKSIEREAVRCKNLVQDLLTFSRVGKPAKEMIDIKEAVEGALSLVLAQSKVKEVELIKELQEVPKISANRTQIQQIIVNLSNNAIDAMPEGGKLTICVRKSMEGQGIEMEVRDTGQGIPEDIRSKIFNPFFTTKEVGKGTGLGLSLVYEIVGKHNGKITLESKVGEGTTFHVFLPFESEPGDLWKKNG